MEEVEHSPLLYTPSGAAAIDRAPVAVDSVCVLPELATAASATGAACSIVATGVSEDGGDVVLHGNQNRSFHQPIRRVLECFDALPHENPNAKKDSLIAGLSLTC